MDIKQIKNSILYDGLKSQLVESIDAIRTISGQMIEKFIPKFPMPDDDLTKNDIDLINQQLESIEQAISYVRSVLPEIQSLIDERERIKAKKN